ncbi:MAG: hypothetical protein IJO45_06980 [Oscillospiraceae bacterium]|nr:hypothetical protein [Oscillospiraceae bacterium]
MFDPVTYILAKNAGGGGSSGGYKGSVASAESLPASGSKGDMYLVSDEGIFYVYDSGWSAVRETAITNAQIDALFE